MPSWPRTRPGLSLSTNSGRALPALHRRGRPPASDQALRERGWDIVRAIDTYPEGTEDEVHFEHAAKETRVLVTNDRRIEAVANRWLEEKRPFRGLILWPQGHYKRLAYAQLVNQIEALSEPCPHAVMHLK